MNIKLYTFNKKSNSTERPPDDAGTLVSGNLRQACSVINPVVGFTGLRKPAKYNYAKIDDFLRCYYITDWEWTGAEWLAHMSVDALASWRPEIGDTRQYIARASADFDGSIKDDFYPVKPVASVQTIPAANWPWTGRSPQSYVVGVVGAGADSGVTYYALNNSGFAQLSSALLGDGDYLGTDFGTLTKEVVKSMFNPFQYLTSVFAYPWSAGLMTSSTLPLGWWSVDVPCRRDPGALTFTTGFTIPAHPDIARGSYLSAYPFTDVQLVFPCFGTMAIDASKAGGAIACAVTVDPRNGNAVLDVTGAGGVQLHHVAGQVGVPTMISQSSVNYVGAAISGAGAVLSAAVPGVGLLGSAAGIGNALGDLLPTVSRGGSNGSFVEFYTQPAITVAFRRPVADAPDRHGRPLCRVRRIADIPGFIMVDDAVLDFQATDFEKTEIATQMEGGFYFE